MANVNLTPMQQAIIQRGANKANLPVPAYLLDQALARIYSHLQLDLGQVITAEQDFVARGVYVACGQTYTVTAGTQPWTYVCVRVTGHRVEGVAARDTHVAPDSQGALTTWQHGQV